MKIFKSNNILKTCFVILVLKVFLLGFFIVPAQISAEKKPVKSEKISSGKKVNEKNASNMAEEKENTATLAIYEKKAEYLENEEEKITIAQKELEDKIQELKNLRKNIASLLKTKEEKDEKNIQHLVKIYSSMKGPQAATIMDRLPDETVIEIFSRMKSDQVAKILPSMSKERAIKVTQLLSSTEN